MATNLGSDTERAQLSAVGAGPTRIGADEMFCQSCGRVIRREAAICVGCGVATRRGVVAGTGLDAKSKSTAVLLAIFFSFLTWIYTYREDAGKFWITTGITVVNVVLSIFTLGIWLFVAFPVGVAFWIWSIIDTATKTDEWYANY